MLTRRAVAISPTGLRRQVRRAFVVLRAFIRSRVRVLPFTKENWRPVWEEPRALQSSGAKRWRMRFTWICLLTHLHHLPDFAQPNFHCPKPNCALGRTWKLRCLLAIQSFAKPRSLPRPRLPLEGDMLSRDYGPVSLVVIKRMHRR